MGETVRTGPCRCCRRGGSGSGMASGGRLPPGGLCCKENPFEVLWLTVPGGASFPFEIIGPADLPPSADCPNLHSANVVWRLLNAKIGTCGPCDWYLSLLHSIGADPNSTTDDRCHFHISPRFLFGPSDPSCGIFLCNGDPFIACQGRHPAAYDCDDFIAVMHTANLFGDCGFAATDDFFLTD